MIEAESKSSLSRSCGSIDGLGQAAEIQSCPVTEYLPVERRLAIGEGDGKPELLRIKRARDRDIGDKKLRLGRKQGGFGEVSGCVSVMV